MEIHASGWPLVAVLALSPIWVSVLIATAAIVILGSLAIGIIALSIIAPVLLFLWLGDVFSACWRRFTAKWGE